MLRYALQISAGFGIYNGGNCHVVLGARIPLPNWWGGMGGGGGYTYYKPLSSPHLVAPAPVMSLYRHVLPYFFLIAS
jgi:hypothetical protein